METPQLRKGDYLKFRSRHDLPNLVEGQVQKYGRVVSVINIGENSKADVGRDDIEPFRKILLVGASGVGKSSLGNFLLHGKEIPDRTQNAFIVAAGADSQPMLRCESYDGIFNKLWIRVTDSPGIPDTGGNDITLENFIKVDTFLRETSVNTIFIVIDPTTNNRIDDRTRFLFRRLVKSSRAGGRNSIAIVVNKFPSSNERGRLLRARQIFVHQDRDLYQPLVDANVPSSLFYVQFIVQFFRDLIPDNQFFHILVNQVFFLNTSNPDGNDLKEFDRLSRWLKSSTTSEEKTYGIRTMEDAVWNSQTNITQILRDEIVIEQAAMNQQQIMNILEASRLIHQILVNNHKVQNDLCDADLALFSYIMYLPEPIMRSCFRLMNFSVLDLQLFRDSDFNSSPSYTVLKNLSSSLICIVFRGTDVRNVADWVANFFIVQTTANDTMQRPIQCHSGYFSKLFDATQMSSWDAITKKIDLALSEIGEDSNRRIIFAGHSQGGAYAMLCHAFFLAHVRDQENMQVESVTFGAPLVFGIGTHPAVRDKLETFSRHYVNSKDIVPRLLRLRMPETTAEMLRFFVRSVTNMKFEQVLAAGATAAGIGAAIGAGVGIFLEMAALICGGVGAAVAFGTVVCASFLINMGFDNVTGSLAIYQTHLTTSAKYISVGQVLRINVLENELSSIPGGAAKEIFANHLSFNYVKGISKAATQFLLDWNWEVKMKDIYLKITNEETGNWKDIFTTSQISGPFSQYSPPVPWFLSVDISDHVQYLCRPNVQGLLQSLILTDWKIGTTGLTTLGPAIADLRNLRTLRLRNCGFADTDAAKLLEHLRPHRALKQIDVSFNSFSKNSKKRFQEDWGHLRVYSWWFPGISETWLVL